MTTCCFAKMKTDHDNKGEPLLAAAERGGRQCVYDGKHVNVWLTFLTKQLQRRQDDHCGNEVGR